MPDKLLYIVRHGQTDLNKQGIVQGRGIDSDLNNEGRKQAGQFFNAYKHIPFDKIYVSTLKRTQQSVQPFIDLGISFEKLSGLDELAWGIMEGKPSSPDTKATFLQLMRDWTGGRLDAKIENGESPNEVKERQLKALDIILSHPEEKTVLICMHGRALRLLLCLLTGKPLSKMEMFPHQNLILYKISYDSQQFKIVDFNSDVHLKHF
ncbi:histidine phosphatase family protein [Mucilaginibacter ginkgonis]|uniref:Histidine phosphatase family protein n=1 Tax=Mucilaginibacter ginkgonis TaxID=2682091 RepID=A0A6I4I0Z2_9SPHI|nr:histidine phosphatase family protein [Mucilaginibacter ginkgonis]QQL51163.1 histidine phosphatase family protein [Mucilaginibacter ginkgonis]